MLGKRVGPTDLRAPGRAPTTRPDPTGLSGPGLEETTNAVVVTGSAPTRL